MFGCLNYCIAYKFHYLFCVPQCLSITFLFSISIYLSVFSISFEFVSFTQVIYKLQLILILIFLLDCHKYLSVKIKEKKYIIDERELLYGWFLCPSGPLNQKSATFLFFNFGRHRNLQLEIDIFR